MTISQISVLEFKNLFGLYFGNKILRKNLGAEFVVDGLVGALVLAEAFDEERLGGGFYRDRSGGGGTEGGGGERGSSEVKNEYTDGRGGWDGGSGGWGGKRRGGSGEEEVGLRCGRTAEKFGTVGGGRDEFRFELKKNENFLNLSDDGSGGEEGVED